MPLKSLSDTQSDTCTTHPPWRPSHLQKIAHANNVKDLCNCFSGPTISPYGKSISGINFHRHWMRLGRHNSHRITSMQIIYRAVLIAVLSTFMVACGGGGGGSGSDSKSSSSTSSSSGGTGIVTTQDNTPEPTPAPVLPVAVVSRLSFAVGLFNSWDHWFCFVILPILLTTPSTFWCFFPL